MGHALEGQLSPFGWESWDTRLVLPAAERTTWNGQSRSDQRVISLGIPAPRPARSRCLVQGRIEDSGDVEEPFCDSTFPATGSARLPELKVTSPALHFSGPYGPIFAINLSNIFLHQHLFLASTVSHDMCHGTIMCSEKNVHLFLCFRVFACLCI